MANKGDALLWLNSNVIFDFTLKFEETILQILPSSSFLIFAAACVFYYAQKNARIRTSKLLWAKVCLALLIIALELVNLILRRLSNVHTGTTFPAAMLDLAAAFATLAVVYTEHRHAIRTSALLGFYLSIGILIDATKSRSYFLRGLVASGVVSAVTGATRLLLVALEEVPKTTLILDPTVRSVSDGEATCGFFGRMFFIFLGPLLRLGYRGVLVLDDLGDLGVEFATTRLFSELMDQWITPSSNNAFFLACCRASKWPILLIIVPRICLTGFLYSKPFVMQAIISHIKRPDDDEKSGLIGAFLLSFLGAAVFNAISNHLKNRLLTRVRGGLLSHLFYKSFRQKRQQGKKHSAITMMSADFETISFGVPACIEAPFALAEAVFATYLLSRFIKEDCLILFVPLVVTVLFGLFFGKRSSAAITLWNAHIEKRVAKTSHVLSQLPAIKSLGLGPQMARFIQSLRVAETNASAAARITQAFSIAASVLVDHLTPVLVVAVGLFTRMFGDEIEPRIIYPALALVTMAKGPLVDLLVLYPQITSMLACFQRVQKFLCEDEHQDPRTFFRTACEPVEEESQSHGFQSKAEKTPDETPPVIFRFENATIAPAGSDEAVLSNLDFCLEEGSVTSMFGPTSSGKSTFLEGMLGEAEVLEGKLHVDETARHIAVCGQEVFLPNSTVRDCIVGTCPYEPTWFNIVITYCKLLEDLRRFPNGELYVVGSGGIGLSGGQRQRIGIARSVYAQTKIIVLDDALSALDSRTASEIVTGLCGRGGLLRQRNCTVVISSYSSECIDIADNLLLLDGSGSATFERSGSGGKLREQVACLLQEGLLGEKEETPTEEVRVRESSLPPVQPTANIEELDESRQKGDKSLYLLWIDAVGRVSMAFFLILIIVVSVSDAIPNVFVRIWVQLAPRDKNYLIGYALLATTAGVLAGIGVLVMMRRLAPRASNGLHEKLTVTTTQATLGYLTTTDSGVVLNRYGEDMDLISKRIPNKLYSTLYSVFAVGSFLPGIFAGATYMTATLPFLGFCFYLMQRYYLRTSRQLRLIEIEAMAPLVTALRDIGNGLMYIRSFGNEKIEFERCLRLVDRSQKPYYFLLASQVLLSLVMDLIVTGMAFALTMFALYLKNTTSENATGLALLNLVTMGSGFSMVVNAFTTLEAAMGSLARLRNYLRDTPTEMKEGIKELPELWPSRGEVVFHNVAARYNIDNKTEQAAVLQNIHLHIEPGKKIGIMGRTGSGKSSLLRSLLGFLEYDGKITIDGVDIKTAPPDELRSRIITISQELVELDGTIRDNLLPFDKSWAEIEPTKVTEEEQNEAERKDRIVVETLVRLGIWEQILTKSGLDCLLEDAKYSFGEKQLFCIARAVVRRRLTGSKLVLIDEATASIDSWREQTVREMMLEYFRGCTIIVVAHREETIADSNHTVHMADGHVQRIESF